MIKYRPFSVLDTLTEISRILYSRPEEHCPRSILRLKHQTFLHAIACEEVIGKLQILSEKKFYGRYLHSLVHAPIQHCIICCMSTSTEQRECHFITLSSISTSASRKDTSWGEGRGEQPKRHIKRATVHTWGVSTLLALSTEHYHTTQSDPEVFTSHGCQHTWKNFHTSSSVMEACSEWSLIFPMSVHQLKLNQEHFYFRLRFSLLS